MKDEKEVRSFIVRMRPDLWLFLKKQTIETGMSMNKLIENAVLEMKLKVKKARKRARAS